MADLLPANATDQERALSEATARIDGIDVPIADLWNPQTCPAALLPWLAWALSVDVWDATWTEAQKRSVIAASVAVHRIKGTRGAVVRALDALGYDVSLVEWFEGAPKGEPYTFRLAVEVDNRGVDESLYSTLEQVVQRAKNVRSHLAGITVAARTRGNTTAGCAPILGDSLTVLPWTITERTSGSPFLAASALAAYDILTVSPLGA